MSTPATPSASEEATTAAVQIHPKSPLVGHELANVFPMMDAAQAAVHRESLKKHGQITAIVLYDGKILDGRNTHKEALEMGLEPVYREFGSDPRDGDSPSAFVIARNLHRRHLAPGQRAAAAVAFVPLFEAEAAERLRASRFGSPEREASSKVVSITEHLSPANPDAQASDGQPAGGEDSAAGSAPTVTTPGTAKKERNKTAVQLAAQFFGTSPTGVALAKSMKKKHSDLYEKVLNEEMTLHAADVEAKARDAAAKNNVSKETERGERLTALKVLEKRHGGANSPFVMQVTQKKILKKHDHLLAFADMKKADAFAVLPLIKLGMAPDAAKKFLDAQATDDSTVSDLIKMAILSNPNAENHQEISRVFIVGDFSITVHREAKEPKDADTSADAAQQSEESPDGEQSPEPQAGE